MKDQLLQLRAGQTVVVQTCRDTAEGLREGLAKVLQEVINARGSTHGVSFFITDTPPLDADPLIPHRKVAAKWRD